MSIGRRDEGRPDDESLERAWRSASQEEPDPRLDAAIVAAARAEAGHDDAAARTVRAPIAEVRRSRRPGWWNAWRLLAAAATVAGLAFVLVQMIPRDREAAPPITIEQARPAVAPPGAPAEAQDAGVPDATSLEAVEPARAAPEPPAGIAAEAGRAAVPMQRATKAPAAPSSPEAWAASIEALVAAGELADAAAGLRAFRALHADADEYLPEALRGWAATVN